MQSKEEMLNLIPEVLRKSRQIKAIFEVVGNKFDYMLDRTGDILDQTYIDDSTWGLEIFEREMNIETDFTKTLAERRSVIKSKKRGIGTVTVALVKSVAEAYYGGEVELREIPEEYLVEIKFISSYGVPTNLEDIENSIREVIPAHLGLEFLFSYILIRDVHNKMTIAELEQQTLDRFSFVRSDE